MVYLSVAAHPNRTMGGPTFSKLQAAMWYFFKELMSHASVQDFGLPLDGGIIAKPYASELDRNQPVEKIEWAGRPYTFEANLFAVQAIQQ